MRVVNSYPKILIMEHFQQQANEVHPLQQLAMAAEQLHQMQVRLQRPHIFRDINNANENVRHTLSVSPSCIHRLVPYIGLYSICKFVC